MLLRLTLWVYVFTVKLYNSRCHYIALKKYFLNIKIFVSFVWVDTCYLALRAICYVFVFTDVSLSFFSRWVIENNLLTT